MASIVCSSHHAPFKPHLAHTHTTHVAVATASRKVRVPVLGADGLVEALVRRPEQVPLPVCRQQRLPLCVPHAHTARAPNSFTPRLSPQSPQPQCGMPLAGTSVQLEPVYSRPHCFSVVCPPFPLLSFLTQDNAFTHHITATEVRSGCRRAGGRQRPGRARLGRRNQPRHRRHARRRRRPAAAGAAGAAPGAAPDAPGTAAGTSTAAAAAGATADAAAAAADAAATAGAAAADRQRAQPRDVLGQQLRQARGGPVGAARRRALGRARRQPPQQRVLRPRVLHRQRRRRGLFAIASFYTLLFFLTLVHCFTMHTPSHTHPYTQR